MATDVRNHVSILRGELRSITRILIRNPRFCLGIIFQLGLGMGATIGMFSIVNAVLLNPLPYPCAEQLVQVFMKVQFPGSAGADTVGYIEPAVIQAWDTDNAVFSELAAFEEKEGTLSREGATSIIKTCAVSKNFLHLFGARVEKGQQWPQGDYSVTEHLALLSALAWRGRFGGDQGIVGKVIRIDGIPYTVVGVVNAGARLNKKYDVFTPIDLRDKKILPQVVGRLKPGIGEEKARVNLEAIFQGARSKQEKTHVFIMSLRDLVLGNVKDSLIAYFIGSICILLISCVNAGNMFFTRGVERRKEIGIRLALGAQRRSILAQLVTESLLLALCSAGVGMVLQIGLKRVVFLCLPMVTSRGDIPTDWTLIAFVLANVIVTSVCFGLIPAVAASRISINDSLKDTQLVSTNAGLTRRHLASIAVVAEIAAAFVLILGAGLLCETFLTLRRAKVGFDPRGMLTANVHLDEARYPASRSQIFYFTEAVRSLEALPGVEAVGVSSSAPFQPNNALRRGIEWDKGAVLFDCASVNEDYFKALGIPIKQGRVFRSEDSGNKLDSVVISESFAKNNFEDRNPIGHKLFGVGPPVIGVVGDVQMWATVPPQPLAYFFYKQERSMPFMTICVRVRARHSSILPLVRDALRSVDKDQDVGTVITMEQQMADSLTPQYINMLLATSLGAFALGLSGFGVYSVISFSAAQRRHEIGIRMALGARRGEIVRMFLREGAILIVAGVFFGLISGVYVKKGVSELLWNVSPSDTMTGLISLLVLVITAGVASYVPAHRSSKCDPAMALRAQ